MRLELLYNPRLLCERLAEISIERRRLRRLRGTVAEGLRTGHIDSLELLDLLRPNPPQVIYDIGANVGTWTLLAKALFPSAEIHAFEPLPFHARQFQEAVASVAGVALHEIALGSQTGETRMKITDFTDASSILSLTETAKRHWNLKEAREISVQIHRLDDWILNERLPYPDLIKLDVQGFELEVLRGAPLSLANTSAILTEVSFFEVYRNQCLFHELSVFLAESGFRLVALRGATEGKVPLLQSEALFLSEERAALLYETL
jgi:FkbM family methyltransferase